jgi:A/G-specific adenine glycosylase
MPTFAQKLIAWQTHHGRHNLPWQGSLNPYGIWVSEIMLQQTQVETVIPYYSRFMARFPDILTLASSTEEEVLTYWAGLGYYARGRNLLKAARIMREKYAGVFPDSIEAVAALPGIGPSTAAAICVFAFGQRHAILDGNVKRVLARVFLVTGYPGIKSIEKILWQQARGLLPKKNLETYTQALMDLGTLICTRTKPRCATCPINIHCAAFGQDRVGAVPSPRPANPLPHKHAFFLVIRYATDVLLEKRPIPGIWGGLWSLPEAKTRADWAHMCKRLSGQVPEEVRYLTPFTHSFSHFKLHVQPIEMTLSHPPTTSGEPNTQVWMPLDDALHAALPKAVKKILAALTRQEFRSATIFSHAN